MKPNSYDDGQSVQALDQNAKTLAQHGYGVASGCSVSIQTGTLGSGESAVSVDSGTLLIDGSQNGTGTANVDISSGDSNPRKDLVVYDTGDSTFKALTGASEAASPEGAIRQDAEVPNPNSLSTSVANLTTGGAVRIPLAEVWVPVDSTGIDAEDISDRRHSVGYSLDSLGVESLTGPIVDNNEVESLLGAYLFVSGSGSISVAGSSLQTDVFDDGTETVSNTTALNFASNLSVTDPGDGSATIDATDSTTSSDIVHDDTQGGTAPDAHHAQTHDNADHSETYTIGNYEIQVDGTDGQGIINFHTQ